MPKASEVKIIYSFGAWNNPHYNKLNFIQRQPKMIKVINEGTSERCQKSLGLCQFLNIPYLYLKLIIQKIIPGQIWFIWGR